MSAPAVLAFTQGDPAGIGPEILLRLLADPGELVFRPILLAERAALDALRPVLPHLPWERLIEVGDLASRDELPPPPAIPLVDPVGRPRSLVFGQPGRDDAQGAIAALGAGLALVRRGLADALVTAPLGKAPIARHLDPGFRGHTDWLAAACGLERYGRDYLMAFLAPGLKVALLTTHLPLREAIDGVTTAAILDALRCLHRHVVDPPGAGRIAVAGLDPHAGEGGLLGTIDEAEVRPAVAAARAEGIDARGPESADSLFARARAGEFDWVLALYHDQGLIPVKTAAFGLATNWTLGLPILRTSPDHGTAYGIAGKGIADLASLRAVVATTLELVTARRSGSRAAGHL